MDHIEIRHVDYEYEASERAVTALRDVSFGVDDSEFICVVGRSGCGKTTLLNILAGFLTPTKGDVLIGGRAVSGRGLDRGVVFQDFAQLFPWRTAQRNVEFGLEMKGVPRDERAKTAQRFLGLVNLEQFAGAYPHELSGGMQQRVAIARALPAAARRDACLAQFSRPTLRLDGAAARPLNASRDVERDAGYPRGLSRARARPQPRTPRLEAAPRAARGGAADRVLAAAPARLERCARLRAEPGVHRQRERGRARVAACPVAPPSGRRRGPVRPGRRDHVRGRVPRPPRHV